MKFFKQPLFYLVILLAVGLVFSIVRAAFQEPTNSFPGSAPAAPLDTSPLYQIKDGNLRVGALGINTDPAGYVLDVAGLARLNNTYTDTINTIDGGDALEINYRSTSPTKICATLNCGTVSAYFDTNGNVGIGITAPAEKLHVSDNGVVAIQITGSNDGGSPGPLLKLQDTGTSGATWNLESGRVAGAFSIYQSGVGTRFLIDSSGNVGIGMNNPAFRLDIGGCPTDGSACLNVGGGSGKINAGTVDPLYSIGGEGFATYLVGMTGVKEETTGVATLNNKSGNGNYEYVINFNNVAKGSDLWLFYQTTAFGEDWGNLAVLLTPGFDGRAWYEEFPAENKLVIYGEPKTYNPSPTTLKVTYRLSAPRFDHASWSNYSGDSSAGFILQSK